VTFTQIVSAVYDECNYGSSPAAGITTRVKRFINEGLHRIVSEPGLGRLIDSDPPYTFATVAGTARYVVPEAVAMILGITERTNDVALAAMDLKQYRRIEPDPTSTSGTPSHYVPIGQVAVATQPSDASAIFAKSDSASDTNTIFLEGSVTGGFVTPPTASSAMTGTTAVQIGGISSYLSINDIYLSVAAVGTITILEDSGSGTELARISRLSLRPRYYGFYLWPTPAAAVTYYVDYQRQLIEMTQDTDEPPLPLDQHQMLIAYAVMREAEKASDGDLLVRATKRYEKLFSNLKYQTQSLSDEIPVMNGGRAIGRSRLGGMYPADYWTRV
jgi:hypothetical protein